LNQLLAARLDLNFDPAGASVERIFQKFFDHRGGALDHFTGRDLIGDGFRKNVNLTHVVKRSLAELEISPAGSRCVSS